jgi:Ribbon-helix-helix domain
MKQSARWTLTVSGDVDRRVRRYLADAGRKGDLSAFVEESVRARLLQLSMRKECNLDTRRVPTRGQEDEADRILSGTYSRPSANDLEAPPQEISAENLKGDGSYGG